MLFNYHTHTARCHHAQGCDREFVKTAIEAGLTELGFSDHCPYPFPEGYVSDFRIWTEDLPGYFSSLLALRREFEGKIRLRIGFEAEYYPAYFDRMLEMIAPYPCDYLILGQHYSGNEMGARYNANRTSEESELAEYTEQVCAALQTGKFSYLAHPDLVNYQGNADTYQKYAEQLCHCAKQTDTPLEINFLGIRDGRHYPREAFFEVVGDVGCSVIFGCDAHHPSALLAKDAEKVALDWCRKYHLTPVTELHLKAPNPFAV